MERTPVTSTTVKSLGYEASTKTLEVEFNSGAIYQYMEVPASVFTDLMRASSHGSFLNRHIRGHYEYVRVQ